MALVREPEGVVHPQTRRRLHAGAGDGIAISLIRTISKTMWLEWNQHFLGGDRATCGLPRGHIHQDQGALGMPFSSMELQKCSNLSKHAHSRYSAVARLIVE